MLMYTTAGASIVHPSLIDNPYSAFIVIIAIFILIIIAPPFIKYLFEAENKAKDSSTINNSKSQTTSNTTQRRFIVQDVKKEVAGKRNRVQGSYEHSQAKSNDKDDYIVKIKEAKALLDSGIISKEEFEKMKQKIIDKI